MSAATRQGRLDGAVVVVTGGAQGIGRAVVAACAREGAHVTFLDRDPLGDRTAKELADHCPERPPVFLACDVTASEQVAAAIRQVRDRHDTIDALVNNAGVAAYYDAAEMTEEEWDGVFAVDLKGVWLCCRAVLPTMRAQRAGSIVNIASIHAHLTNPGAFPYAAAKSGVLGLTRSLALDEGPRGIRVNAVSPGYTRTQLVQEYFDQQPDPEAAERAVLDVHPLGRIATPDEVARAVVFLASDDASVVTGSELTVDGGLSARFAS